ncbi:MAG: glycine betaine/L-proline ABC transporter ATP-binding protein [Proteobacteria bacterium]|nr:glycine betaine/L-proline ABC transporter ATP-binding protein [Pseudomonadota bacterium]
MPEDGTVIGVSIRGLYKVFGPNAAANIERARGGIGKAELLDRHGHVLALRNISIEIPGGGIQVIMGLSGSGKSTLVRHINRLIDPTAGEVIAGGRDVTAMSPRELRAFRQTKTAMVFQKFALLPHRTVLENAAYGLKVKGVKRAMRHAAAAEWIERVDLKGFESRYPHQLSGGMQQRVGLARALANDAPILLMDEAFSALDPLIRVDMQTMLLKLQKDFRKTIVFITHDLDEALRLGDQIAVLRDGEVIQQGTGQDIILRPADDYIARFVRDVNRGRVIKVEAVMQPLREPVAADEARITMGTSLEDTARFLSQSGKTVALVADAAGRPVGRVDAGQIMFAMVAHDRPSF